jgi:hypothetical protein
MKLKKCYWFFHDYGAYFNYKVIHYVDPDFGNRWDEVTFVRNCKKCGKIQVKKKRM